MQLCEGVRRGILTTDLENGKEPEMLDTYFKLHMCKMEVLASLG
jgi:hypothetical protein